MRLTMTEAVPKTFVDAQTKLSERETISILASSKRTWGLQVFLFRLAKIWDIGEHPVGNVSSQHNEEQHQSGEVRGSMVRQIVGGWTTEDGMKTYHACTPSCTVPAMMVATI